MKKKVLFGLLSVPLVLAMALSLGGAALADMPTLPHQFWGTVSIEGEPAGAGVTVSAEIGGVTFTCESGVTDAQGRYGMDPDDPFYVPSDNPETPAKDGGVNGDEVIFKVNNVVATKTVLRGPSTFEAGGASEVNLSIGALALTADAGGPYSGTEGEIIALSGSAIGGTPDYTYAWDLDGDDIYNDATGATASHSWGTAGTYTIGLQVTDDVSATDTDTATVTVTAPAPQLLTAEAGGPYSGTTGASIALSGSAIGGTPDYTYAWDLDGDDIYNDATGATASHSWGTAGTYTIGLQVTDDVSATDTDTATVTVTAPAPADAGGGGGGAPTYYTETNLFGTEARFRIDSDGEILKTIEATHKNLTITIPKGTIALGKDGKRLKSLEADVDLSPPDPPENASIIGLAYDFGPVGATFDPPITLTWVYDPDALLEGVAEGDLVLAFYDEAAGEWVELECVVDTENNTITASVAHFTTFAIIGAVTPAPAPAPTPAPTPTPTPTNWGLIGGSIAGVIVIIVLLVYFLWWRRRTA